MRGRRRSKGIAIAGTALIGLGLVQLGGIVYFCARGGMEDVVSPVTAAAMGWRLAALLVYLGGRMRRAESWTR